MAIVPKGKVLKKDVKSLKDTFGTGKVSNPANSEMIFILTFPSQSAAKEAIKKINISQPAKVYIITEKQFADTSINYGDKSFTNLYLTKKQLSDVQELAGLF